MGSCRQPLGSATVSTATIAAACSTCASAALRWPCCALGTSCLRALLTLRTLSVAPCFALPALCWPCVCLPAARRVVPGATDDLIAVRKSKSAPKAAAKHVTELPVLPNYEYELPVAAEEKQAAAPQLSADELKVRGVACCRHAGLAAAAQAPCCDQHGCLVQSLVGMASAFVPSQALLRTDSSCACATLLLCLLTGSGA